MTHRRGFAPPRPSPSVGKYDLDLQNTWLHNAITDGPLPRHYPYPTGRAFSIEDDDPSAERLNDFQKQLAETNRNGRLLSYDRPTRTYKRLN
jgi:hypothetical protein